MKDYNNENYNEFSPKEEDDSLQMEIIFSSRRLQDLDSLEDDKEDALEMIRKTLWKT